MFPKKFNNPLGNQNHGSWFYPLLLAWLAFAWFWLPFTWTPDDIITIPLQIAFMGGVVGYAMSCVVVIAITAMFLVSAGAQTRNKALNKVKKTASTMGEI